MNSQEFLKQRRNLLKQLDAAKAEFNQTYTQIAKLFIEKNCHVKVGQVYELLKNGIKRRGFKRFVIYDRSVMTMGSAGVMINVGGWWLNENSIPTKWDNFTVYGVSNNAILQLSENQEAQLHPDSKEKAEA